MVLSMVWHGSLVCIGYKREYTILNSETGEVSDVLVPADRTKPLIQMTNSEEFLLSANESLGVFITFEVSLPPFGFTTRIKVMCA
jgi:hypothetical protein